MGGNGESIWCLMEGEEGCKAERDHGEKSAASYEHPLSTHLFDHTQIHTYSSRDCKNASPPSE